MLVNAAWCADVLVLVLGHRGRGAARSAQPGSVGLHRVLHAGRPVTVVRPAEITEPAPAAGTAVAAYALGVA